MTLLRALAPLVVTLALQDPEPVVAIDQPVRDWTLRDLMKDGDPQVSLSGFRGKKTVVLVFTSYSCDACLEYEGRLQKMMGDFKEKPVVFLGVRSSAEDTPADMRKYAESKKLGIPILDDPRNRMANYFKVRVTPTFCVIDPNGVLRFWGACDENINEKRATKTYVHDALQAILDGKAIAVREAKAVGCHMPRAEDDQK
jgi:peroxiredoxin